MPRLLILCEYPTLLGGERSMLATLPAVAAAGFEILIAAPSSGPLAEELQTCDITRVDWPTHDDNGHRFPLDQLRADLGNIIQQTRPDILHANTLSTARISGPVISECKTPSIGHLRDIIKLQPQSIADINRHGRLLAVSRATRDFHITQKIDATKCHVVYNGVDLTVFQPRAPTGYLHRELAVPPNTRFCAIIGQLGLRKATDVALAAALQITDQVPRCPLAHRRRADLEQRRVARI